jgi:ubiquinone/menaquinone biosynthesis C-methylase UbiE
VDTTRDPYGSIARFYDGVLGSMTTSVRARSMRVCPVTTGMRVLDVGCGTGMYLDAYTAAGAVGTGIDRSPAMLAVARERLGGRASLELADATNMPFSDDSFDVVVASLLLHELDLATGTMILDEMARVATPGGRIMVVDYRVGPLRWKGRFSRGISFVSERIAGRSHYRNWRTFLGAGGLPTNLPDPLTIELEKVIAGGNLSIWMISPGRT